MKDKYKTELEKAKKELKAFEQNLFTLMVNLMMSGELNEWSLNSPIGEEIVIDITLLEACTDEKVKSLLILHTTTLKVLEELG